MRRCGFCKCSGKSPTSIKSAAAVIAALEITFSSSRTFPGPVVLQQGDLRAAREALKRLSVCLAVFLQEMLDENGNVFGALREPRNTYFDGAEAVEKSSRKRPARTSARRSRLVAAMIRTSTFFGSGEPRAGSRGFESRAATWPASAAMFRQLRPEKRFPHWHIRTDRAVCRWRL